MKRRHVGQITTHRTPSGMLFEVGRSGVHVSSKRQAKNMFAYLGAPCVAYVPGEPYTQEQFDRMMEAGRKALAEV